MRAVFAFAVLVLGACAEAPIPRAEPQTAEVVIEAEDRVEAVAVGAPDPILPSQTQRKATAREAALAKARHELSSALRKLVLQSGITLGNAVAFDSRLSDRIDQEVSLARATTEFTPDDGCIVRMVLSKRRVGEYLGVRFR